MTSLILLFSLKLSPVVSNLILLPERTMKYVSFADYLLALKHFGMLKHSNWTEGCVQLQLWFKIMSYLGD